MPTIGEVVKREEGVFEWTVRDFMSLPEQVDDRYDSPSFPFGGARWHLSMYPNGERNKSEGYIGLYLARRSSGPPIELNFSLGMKTTKNDIFREVRGTDNFEDKLYESGTKFRRSRLLRRQSEVTPSGHLTFVCRMKHVESPIAAKSVASATNTPASRTDCHRQNQTRDIIQIDETRPMTSYKSTRPGP